MAKLVETLQQLDSIIVTDSCTDWKAAVRLCFKPLLQHQYITENYIEAAIQSGIELNFYYLIAEGLAMPHARPECGALKNGLSLLIVKEGVRFEDHRNNPITCLIGLAAAGSDDHIQAMMDISEIFGDESIIGKLAALPDAAAVLRFLKNPVS